MNICILAKLKVKCAKRLVKQQHARTVDQRTRNSHTLLLTAGERGGLAQFKALQADIGCLQ